jgi:hypothetical protein
MKKFIVKSGFITKENEGDKNGNFVERSSIEVEANSIKEAKIIATNMSLFERKKQAWDPMAGPTLHIEELKPEITDKNEGDKDKIGAQKEASKVDLKDKFKEAAKSRNKTTKDTVKELVKEPIKPKPEETKTKKGPGRPRKNPQ